ncbi:MAG: guanylate kinase [Candidatus Gracilibacteria bacterium]
MQNLKGKLVLIVGPSGSGKGTIIKHLREKHPDWVYPVSYTTRIQRPGEQEGLVYHFISEKEFQERVKAGRFLEYAIIHEKGYYGTDRDEILGALGEGKVVVREVDIQGFHSICKIVPAKDLLTIFIEAGDLGELKRRIAERGKLPEEEVERRMESARREIAQADECNYRIVNEYGKIEEAVNEVDGIILKELNV